MATVAGFGVAAPAVLPISAWSRRRTTKPMTITATAVAAKAIFKLRMMLLRSILFCRLGVGFQGLVRHTGLARAALPQLLDDRIKDRHEGESEAGFGKHATE